MRLQRKMKLQRKMRQQRLEERRRRQTLTPPKLGIPAGIVAKTRKGLKKTLKNNFYIYIFPLTPNLQWKTYFFTPLDIGADK